MSAKWCSYCRAATHDDAECWCTRPSGWTPPTITAFHGPEVFKSDVPPGYWDALLTALAKCERLPEQDISNDPEPAV